jgi:gliding motility-associated-like protein
MRTSYHSCFEKVSIIFIVIFSFLQLNFPTVSAQKKMYSYAGNGVLSTIDLSTCTFSTIGTVFFSVTYPGGGGYSEPFTDIAVTPNGRIYATINGNKIFELDTIDAHILRTLSNTQGYSYVAALVALDDQHLITIATNASYQRFLASISLVDGSVAVIGNIGGYYPSGDITWLHGNLYMSNANNHLIRFSLSNDFTSITSMTDIGLMQTAYSKSFGLTTVVLGGCGKDSAVIYSFDGPHVYAVNPYTATTRLVCTNIINGYGSYGAASSEDGLSRADSLLCVKPVDPTLPADTSSYSPAFPADTVVALPPPLPEEASYFFIPNLFTPNGDGYNDQFYCATNNSTLTILMQIYNRWGELIYEERSARPSWNGKTNHGVNCSSGIYYFLIITKGPLGEEKSYKGALMLTE